MANVQKTFATVLGAVLLLVGILGFFSNPILGLFGVTGVHNWVHVLSGIVLLIGGLAAGGMYAKNINITFGIVYLLVAILGFLGVGFVNNLLGVNTADNVLHVLIAIAALGVGFGAKN